MILIAAVNNNWGIGKGNDLLYHISEDMKFFRSKTKDNVIIIGRKTLESFPGGKPLKNRVNIVLTTDKNYKAEDTVICNSVYEVLEKTKDYPDKEIYLCGGEKVYREFLDYCDTALITKVFDDKDAEKFLANLDEAENWDLTDTSEIIEEDGLSFQFCTYKNTSVKN